jgi:sulfopropanediol 3-dehydrogenase
MARYLKQGMSGDFIADQDDRVRETVETIIRDVDTLGDEALRDYSERFDQWSPESFRLNAEQIAACHDELPAQVVDDIKFAQEQIRNFAQAQIASPFSQQD